MSRGNEFVFPILYGQTNGQEGMTIREYAAIEIAAGLSAVPENGREWAGTLAQRAVETADALLAELEKKG